jgi:hypothetical protein
VRRLGLERAVVVAVLVLAPAAVAAALRLPLINQLDWADAWFYSAYAWVPKHHFAVYGWNYFSVRFPAILSIGVFERVFGTYGGYVVLRYVLAVASGAAVYLAARRVADVWVALASAVLLYLNPFFSRMLLWDYAGFVAVAAGVVGFALWWWADDRHLAWTLLPGAALALALFANAFVGTALFVLFVVELVSAVRTGLGACLRFAARVGISVLAGLVVFALGYAGYVAIIGGFGPLDLVRPTIDFFRSNSENSAPYQHLPSQWLLHEVRIWAPVVFSLALVGVLGRRVLATDLRARIAQTCIAYTAFLWLYRATVTSSVVETWWAYDFVVMVIAPAVALLLSEAVGRRRGWLVAVVLAGLLALALRTADDVAGDTYEWVSRHPAADLALLAAGAACAALLLVRVEPVRAVALAGVLVVTTLLAWAPSIFDGRGTTGVFATDWARDWHAYAAGRSLADLVRDYDSAQSHVYTWYPGTTGLTQIGWTTLPQLGTTVQLLGYDQPLNQLLPLGRARLRQPTAAYVLIMSPRRGDLPAATRALRDNGFRFSPVDTGSWADGGLRFLLLRLTARPTF